MDLHTPPAPLTVQQDAPQQHAAAPRAALRPLLLLQRRAEAAQRGVGGAQVLERATQTRNLRKGVNQNC